MSKKNKRARSRRQKDIDHLGIARRELSKRNAKLALQHARLGHQQSPRGESREVLQCALLARAEQLYDGGSLDQAKGLIDELTALGVLTPELNQRLERLRAFLGLSLPGGNSPCDQAAALPEKVAEGLADEAILRPKRRVPTYSELNEQADVVREVLRRIEDGDDAAVERLASIPRKSPFADWRLFARGLVGHYAGDADRAASNWDRLDPQRPAYRIANHLLVFSGRRQPEQCGFDVATGQKRLQVAVAGSPVISQLEQLRDRFRSGRMGDVLQTFRSLKQRCDKTHGKLLERVTELLWRRFVREADERSLSKLTTIASGPPLDPRWHRARALIQEEQECGDLNRQEQHWTAYVKDLQQCSVLSKEERMVASGLVLLRLARDFVYLADSEEDTDSAAPWMVSRDEKAHAEYIAAVRRQAEKYLRDAIRWHPQLLNAHHELVSLLRDADEPESAVEAARQLLKQFPDHFETLSWLGNYFVEADKPAEAEEYVDRASRLRPRDPATQTLIWHQRLGMLRQLVRKRRFDEARQQLAEAFVHRPNDVYPYSFDVLQATIEYKAKNVEAAERHLQAAQNQLQEPTVIWLMMHSCADRYGLDRKLKNDFRDRFQAAVRAGFSSQTAGHMAHFLTGFLARRVKYVGFATHQRLVLAYLNRAQRVAWQNDDLRNVCQFLTHLDHWQGKQLRRRLVAEGRKRFPRDPLFPLLTAVAEIEAGPFGTDFERTASNLELALELNESAEYRLSEADVERAKACLSAVQSTREMMSSMMGGFTEFMAAALGFEDDDDWEDEDDDDWDDDEDDWDEDDGAEEPRGGTRRRTRSASGQSARQRSGPRDRQKYFDF